MHQRSDSIFFVEQISHADMLLLGSICTSLTPAAALGQRHSGHLASTSSCGKVDELKIEVHFSYFGIEVGSFSSPPSLLTKCCEVPQLLDCAMCPAGGASEKNKPVYQ